MGAAATAGIDLSWARWTDRDLLIRARFRKYFLTSDLGFRIDLWTLGKSIFSSGVYACRYGKVTLPPVLRFFELNLCLRRGCQGDNRSILQFPD